MNNIVSLTTDNNEIDEIIKYLANSEESSKLVVSTLKKLESFSDTEKLALVDHAAASTIRLKYATSELVDALGYTQKELEISKSEAEHLKSELELKQKIIKDIEINKKYDKEKVDTITKEHINSQIISGKVIPGNILLACTAYKNFKSASGNNISPDKSYGLAKSTKSIKK